jgi:hypothetical protein
MGFLPSVKLVMDLPKSTQSLLRLQRMSDHDKKLLHDSPAHCGHEIILVSKSCQPDKCASFQRHKHEFHIGAQTLKRSQSGAAHTLEGFRPRPIEAVSPREPQCLERSV